MGAELRMNLLLETGGFFMSDNVSTTKVTPTQLGMFLVAIIVIVGLSMWAGSRMTKASVVDTSKYTHIIDSLNNKIDQEQAVKDKAVLAADSLGKELHKLAVERAKLETKLAGALKGRVDNWNKTASMSDADLVRKFNEEVDRVKKAHP